MSSGPEESLRKARIHLRQASLEGLEAARALLQAATQASGRAEASGDSWADNLQRSLDELISALRKNASFTLPDALAKPLAAALEVEIKRWERRSQTDPDARLVLRAFLGLRELLWEFGTRRPPEPTSEESPPSSGSRGPARPRRQRVQRFKIED